MKVLLILISGLLLNTQSYAACSKKWGPGKLIQSKQSICQFIADKNTDPTYLSTKLNKWNNKQNLYVTLNVKKVKSLKGIRFDFLNKNNEIVDKYELPKFTDPDFNIIQEDSTITLSIPTSQLKELKDSEIEYLGIYIATDKSDQVEFTIKEIVQAKKKHEGRISITFDDGYLSNIEAAKVTSLYKMPVTGYFIPSAIGKEEYVSWKNVKALEKKGWSISSHMTTPLTEIAINQLKNRLKTNQNTLSKKSQSKNSANHFALPLGKHNKDVINVLKSVYKTNRLASGGTESLPPADLYRLKVINVLEKTSHETLFQQAKAAVDNQEWAIFMFHYIDSPDKKDLNYSMYNFKQFIKKIAPFNKKIKSVNDVITELN